MVDGPITGKADRGGGMGGGEGRCLQPEFYGIHFIPDLHQQNMFG